MSYDNSHTTDRLQQPDLPETASATAPEAPAPQQDHFADAAWKPDSHYPPINPDPVIRQTTPAPFPRDGDYPPINPDPVVPQMVPAPFPRDSDFEPVAPPDHQPPQGLEPAASPRDTDFKSVPLPANPGSTEPTTEVNSPKAPQDPAGEHVQPLPATPETTTIEDAQPPSDSLREVPSTPAPALQDIDTAAKSPASSTGELQVQTPGAQQDTPSIPGETAPPTGHDRPNDEASIQPDVDDMSQVTEKPKAFQREDLTSTGVTDPTYGEEFMTGPDGKRHFAGDEEGTERTDTGKLKGANGRWASDANPRATSDLEVRAQHDIDARRQHTPQAGASDADNQTIAAVQTRDNAVKDRDSTWDRISAIADKLRPHDITIDKHTTRNADRDLSALTEGLLTGQEQAALDANLGNLVTQNQQIKSASESIGVAGGALTVEREFPDAIRITGGEPGPGTSGNFDRMIMVDEKSGTLIMIEEKGVGSSLGSRLVPPLDGSHGRHIRAEQGSTEYLRQTLEHDNKLAAELTARPGLRGKIEEIIHGGGTIRYLLARTSQAGVVTVTDFKIDKTRLDQANIRLPRNGA